MKQKRYKISIVMRDGHRIDRPNVVCEPVEVIRFVKRLANEVSGRNYNRILALYLNRGTKRSRCYEISREGIITKIIKKNKEDECKRNISKHKSGNIFSDRSSEKHFSEMLEELKAKKCGSRY